MLQDGIYHQLAAADGVHLDSPKHTSLAQNNGNNSSSKAGDQAFSLNALSGDYRRVIHKPEQLTWKLLEYSDPDEPLALSELERLAGGKEPKVLQGMIVGWFDSSSVLMQSDLCP